MRWLRLLAFVVACAVGLGLLRYRAARASVEDWLTGVGAHMAPYLNDPSARERPRRFEVNGVSLWVAAGRTSEAPPAVRRHFADRFADPRHGGDALAAALREAEAEADADPRRLGQLAFGDDERGGLAALDFGAPVAIGALAERLARFVDSGELGDLGQIRFVYFERAPDGGTQYLNVWTTGGASLDALLPLGGRDVAGGDLEGVPRPPKAQRVLAAGEAGQPQRLRIYRVAEGSLAAVRDFYVRGLGERGWTRDEGFARFAGANGRAGERFARGGRDLYLDFARIGDDVDVVAVEMGR